jgi:hypothetical protein
VILIVRYRTARPGEAGLRLVPDQAKATAERKLLEGLGFTVIEITSHQHLMPDGLK